MDTARELVRLGADVHAYPSFFLAAARGFTSLLTDMIEKGARVNQRRVCAHNGKLFPYLMYFDRGITTRFHVQQQYGTSNSKLPPHYFGLGRT